MKNHFPKTFNCPLRSVRKKINCLFLSEQLSINFDLNNEHTMSVR